MKNERHIVFEIISQNKYSNLELQKYTNHPRRAFITRLIYTLYQNYEALAYQTKDFLKEDVPQEIEIILVMAAGQFYMMDSISEYAIVNEAVNLAKKVHSNYGPLVNAVLRKMIQREFRDSQSDDELVDLSINTSHPLWQVKLLKAQYGLDVTRKILEHNNTIPPLDIRYNEKKISLNKLLEKYPVDFDGNNLVAQADIFKTDALKKGLLVMQDRNSQKLIDELKIDCKENILDACCAPGTKLVQLASKFKNGFVKGVDLHPHRIALTQNLVDAWSIENVDLVVSDILEFTSPNLFDFILCDVPCSGLGVMRRKPDIKSRIQPQDLDELQALQIQIIDHCATLLKEDGDFLYATCTLNKKENEKQIEAFLERHPEFELVHQVTHLGYQNNGDSFYGAHLHKKNGIINTEK